MTTAQATMPAEWKGLAGWIAGGIGVLLLSLLATFPYEALHARVLAEVVRATGMDVRVADWGVGVPLGLEWRYVTVTAPAGEAVRLPLVRAKLGLLKALAGGVNLDVVIHLDDPSANGGTARATLTGSSYGLVGPVTVKGQLQQLDLSKLARRYVTHGQLSGDFSQRVESAEAPFNAWKGEGTWKAEVKDLAVDGIAVGAGKTLALAFSRVSIVLTCRDVICDVNELKGDGLDGSFTGDGKITWQQPLAQSQLALSVTVVPGAGFTAKAGSLGLPPLPPGSPMTLKIQGTLAQPRLAL